MFVLNCSTTVKLLSGPLSYIMYVWFIFAPLSPTCEADTLAALLQVSALAGRQAEWGVREGSQRGRELLLLLLPLLAERQKDKLTQRNKGGCKLWKCSMAGPQDFQQGSLCPRKTWINILLGILQLLSPCIQHGGAQRQGVYLFYLPRFNTTVANVRQVNWVDLTDSENIG